MSPYQADRVKLRATIGENYIEIFVDTPLEVCEERDIKGMYAKARKGLIKDFTGVNDPYERPENAEIFFNGTGKIEIEKIISALTNSLK